VHKDIKARQEEVGEVSLEEAALLSRVTNHAIVTRAEILTTAKIFMHEAEQLAEGEFQLLDICHLFLDCSDRACEQVRARNLANEGARLMQAGDTRLMQADHQNASMQVGSVPGRQAMQGNAQSSQDQDHVAHMAYPDDMPDLIPQDDYQTTSLRVVDPINDEGVWAIVDDACNSCCHGASWRKNAEAKWKNKGFHSAFAIWVAGQQPKY
jgi:hypothetical protein